MKYHRFVLIWMLIFATSFAALLSLDLAPLSILKMRASAFAALAQNAQADTLAQSVRNAEMETTAPYLNAVVESGVEPQRIVIEKIGVSSPVMNPDTTDIATLDAELKKGVVRYPGSGFLNEESNMFLFGHSTGLKNVQNRAYEAFNHLDKLNVGDVIKVYAEDSVYEYTVTSVSLAQAEDALVTFSTGKKMLTLSTCNTFGKKEDRFVVTAEFVRQSSLSQNI